MQAKKAQTIALGAIGIGLVAVVLLYMLTTRTELGQKPPASFAELGGDFSLLSNKGEVSLSDHKGKAVVLYFGFLSCPEVCPNSMSVIAGALNRLSEDDVNNVQVMLISIDPERDTVEQLASFSEYFHPNFIGLTGNRSNIDQVTRQYGAYYSIGDVQSDDYVIEHSSRYYVIDKTGKLVDAMRHSTTSNELAARLKTVI